MKIPALGIGCKFISQTEKFKHPYLASDKSTGAIPKERVIGHVLEAMEAMEAMEAIVQLAKEDITNIQNCVAYINKNFPHANIDYYDFTLDFYNLSVNEIIECVEQKELDFVCFDIG